MLLRVRALLLMLLMRLLLLLLLLLLQVGPPRREGRRGTKAAQERHGGPARLSKLTYAISSLLDDFTMVKKK